VMVGIGLPLTWRRARLGLLCAMIPLPIFSTGESSVLGSEDPSIWCGATALIGNEVGAAITVAARPSRYRAANRILVVPWKSI